MERSCSNISGSLIQDSSFPSSRWQDGGGGFGWALSWPSSENRESQRSLHRARGNSGWKFVYKTWSFLSVTTAGKNAGWCKHQLPSWVCHSSSIQARQSQGAPSAQACLSLWRMLLWVAGNLVLSLPALLGSLASCILQAQWLAKEHSCMVCMAAGPLLPWPVLSQKEYLLEVLVQPEVPAEGCWESELQGGMLQNTIYGIRKAMGVVVSRTIWKATYWCCSGMCLGVSCNRLGSQCVWTTVYCWNKARTEHPGHRRTSSILLQGIPAAPTYRT